MTPETLTSMANQIGTFYETMPDRPEAMHDLVMHIKKFWDPRMRRALLVQLDSGDHQLTPLVLSAIQEHRALL